MATILDGKALAAKMRLEIAEEVKALAAEVQELADHYPEKKND